MMLNRLCAVCGKTVPQGQRCECQKKRHIQYNQEHRLDSSKFYYSRAWKNLSAMVKARANGCDEYILYTEHRIIPGVLSHHIEPSDKCPDLKFRADNLIYVSAKTHRMIHDEYSKSEQSKLNMQHKLIEIRNNRQ